MLGVVLFICIAIGIGALLWWGSKLPPTRPRPGSRHRGPTFMSVHSRLDRRRRR